MIEKVKSVRTVLSADVAKNVDADLQYGTSDSVLSDSEGGTISDSSMVERRTVKHCYLGSIPGRE